MKGRLGRALFFITMAMASLSCGGPKYVNVVITNAVPGQIVTVISIFPNYFRTVTAPADTKATTALTVVASSGGTIFAFDDANGDGYCETGEPAGRIKVPFPVPNLLGIKLSKDDNASCHEANLASTGQGSPTVIE